MRQLAKRTPYLVSVLLMASACDDDSPSDRPVFLGPESTLQVTCSVTPASGQTPLTVRVNAEPADAQSVQWTFGDGAGANDASASHTYRISGNFAPTVVIRDRGREGVCRQSVSVVPPPQPPGPTAPPNTLPRVLVKLEPAASGPAPYTLTINACPTYDVDDDPMTFRIVFGDRTPDVSGDCRPVHTYQARGTYVVRVCVSDGKGETCKQHLVTAT